MEAFGLEITLRAERRDAHPLICKARKELGMDQGTKTKRRNSEREPIPKRETKGAVRRWWNTESCQKMIGAVNRRERRRRASEAIAGTEARTRQNRDQRGQTKRVQRDHKGSGKRKNQGISGGSSVKGTKIV